MESRQTLAFYPYIDMPWTANGGTIEGSSYKEIYFMTTIHRLNDIKCIVQIDCGTILDSSL